MNSFNVPPPTQQSIAGHEGTRALSAVRHPRILDLWPLGTCRYIQVSHIPDAIASVLRPLQGGVL